MNRHLRRAARSRLDYRIPSEKNGGNLRASRERLQRLLAETREAFAWMAARPGRGAVSQSLSHMLKSLGPVARVRRLDRIEVYQAPGDYHADVVFQTISVGATDRIGTPVNNPVPTYEEAERMAKVILYALLDLEKVRAEQAPNRFATFNFFDNPVQILLDDLAALEALPGFPRLTEAEAIAQFDQVLQAPVLLDGDGTEDVVAYGFDEVWMMRALLAGVTAYPTSKDGGPSWETGSPLH